MLKTIDNKSVEINAYDKILIYMFDNKNLFISAKQLASLTGHLFLGYECSARFSELRSKKYGMGKFFVEKKEERFVYAKIDWKLLKKERAEFYKMIENKHKIIFKKK